jgi:hypothetical protein
MRVLANEPPLRAALARAGHAYWQANHTLDVMAADYQRLIIEAAARPAPAVNDLPSHFTDDYSAQARGILAAFGIPMSSLGWS